MMKTSTFVLAGLACLLIFGFIFYGVIENRWNPPKANQPFDRHKWVARPEERFPMWQSAASHIHQYLRTLEPTIETMGIPDSRWTNSTTVHLMYSFGSRSKYPPENIIWAKKPGDIDIWYMHVIFTNGVFASYSLKAT